MQYLMQLYMRLRNGLVRDVEGRWVSGWLGGGGGGGGGGGKRALSLTPATTRFEVMFGKVSYGRFMVQHSILD